MRLRAEHNAPGITGHGWPQPIDHDKMVQATLGRMNRRNLNHLPRDVRGGFLRIIAVAGICPVPAIAAQRKAPNSLPNRR